MSNNRPPKERIAELEKQLEQIKAKKRALQHRVKAEERKARTKRLIQIGAEVEHYTGREINDLEAFKKYLEQYAYAIAKTQE